MKLVIELNDSDLRKAVSDQVGRAVASMTDAAIREKVDQILGIKFGRVDDKMIEDAVKTAALVVVRDANGERRVNWGQDITSLAKESIRIAAVALVKDTLARKDVV